MQSSVYLSNQPWTKSRMQFRPLDCKLLWRSGSRTQNRISRTEYSVRVSKRVNSHFCNHLKGLRIITTIIFWFYILFHSFLPWIWRMLWLIVERGFHYWKLHILIECAIVKSQNLRRWKSFQLIWNRNCFINKFTINIILFMY